MSADPLLVALLVLLLACLALLLWLWRRLAAGPTLAERLGAGTAAATASAGAVELAHTHRAPLAPLPQALSDFGLRLAGTAQDREQTGRLLVQAGWRQPQAVGLLMCAKYGCGLLLCAAALGLLVSPQGRFGLTGLATGLLALFAGTTLPELMVKTRAARRHESLSRSMPDALDLMVICAEAGLPFARILRTISRELALSAPAMADELAYTSAELQLLTDRSRALQNLAQRTQVPAIESMVASLVQAERYGTPLAQALRTIAEESRSCFILALEEKAGKLPAQLSVPLMTLILPPVVAVVAAPALMRVIRSLMQ